jgi:heme-degrading monooxygenase HmoA
MSIIMTLRVKGDPDKLEQMAASEPDRMRSIADEAKQHGVMAHRFYGSDDGQIMVVDEWPDAESFQTFFEKEQGRIQPLMQDAGVTSEPEITFWRKLEARDEVGWGA